jgi:hypothetical protein
MGTLVVKAYPTTLFAKAADHTYIECGTGALGWSCWGGKTGGSAVRQADGSTCRANDIAEPNERAGITCYLINGVCHQAANRILLPAGITVNGVRGYALSNAIYGVYGRGSGWPCRAPFDQHPATTGDLPDCVAPPTIVSAPTRTDLDEADARYIAEVLAIYREFDRAFDAQVAQEERENFHLQLFAHMVDFYVGSRLGDRRQELIEIRRATEQRQQKVEEQVPSDGPLHPELIQEVNDLTLDFQTNLAQVTTDDEYERLLQLPKEERIVLADPDVTGHSYA